LEEARVARDEVHRELTALQGTHAAAVAQYKDEIERRDQQIAAVEAMGKEREQWREAVFDRRIEETLKPYRDRQGVLDTQVRGTGGDYRHAACLHNSR